VYLLDAKVDVNMNYFGSHFQMRAFSGMLSEIRNSMNRFAMANWFTHKRRTKVLAF
jgi:hypothetical protein